MRTLAILLAAVSAALAADQPRVWREQIKTALSVSNPRPPLAPETHEADQRVKAGTCNRVRAYTPHRVRFGCKQGLLHVST
ncbi:MAG: hypothetical protein HY736_02990 [Verrucomicrobia bacterium]|nr:hypothetical protein [Verrucomicrobiota bacterium]